MHFGLGRSKHAMTMMEKADRFFGASGFWSSVLPYMVTSNVVVIAIALSPLAHGFDDRRLLAAGVVVIMVFAIQSFRYRLAARKHQQLKEFCGDAYARLLEEGKISINALTVLLMGAPGRDADRLIPGADKINGRDPRLGW